MTAAMRILHNAKIEFTIHSYDYLERGGTKHSSQELGVDEHIVIKTIILEDENKKPIVGLMHGDKEISLKNLARIINVKTVKVCDPQTANKHSGYLVGGTSPFGLKKQMPVYLQESILELPLIYINGGKRGLLVSLNPNTIANVISIIAADFVSI